MFKMRFGVVLKWFAWFGVFWGGLGCFHGPSETTWFRFCTLCQGVSIFFLETYFPQNKII